MGTQGTSTITFGAFPGSSNTSVTITGQGAILSGSLVEAWLLPAATADHTSDEHVVDGPVITAGNIVAGTGFTIYATARDGIPVPDATSRGTQWGTNSSFVDSIAERGRTAPMPYGIWSVAWVWN